MNTDPNTDFSTLNSIYITVAGFLVAFIATAWLRLINLGNRIIGLEHYKKESLLSKKKAVDDLEYLKDCNLLIKHDIKNMNTNLSKIDTKLDSILEKQHNNKDYIDAKFLDFFEKYGHNLKVK